MEPENVEAAEAAAPNAELDNLSVEELKERIAGQNKLVQQAQGILANMREDYLAREQFALAGMREARKNLEVVVRSLAKKQDYNLDDGRKWHFDIDKLEFRVVD